MKWLLGILAAVGILVLLLRWGLIWIVNLYNEDGLEQRMRDE